MRIETLFTNGRFLTMDPRRPAVTALAIAAGRIAATGDAAALAGLRDRDTEVIDLGGRFAGPAFVDPHIHLGMLALAPAEADCRTPPLRTIPALLERIRALAAVAPPGRWLRGHGYDEEALRERRHPTRAELDEAAPDNPLVLVHWSVHRCVLNSLALAALGIGAETPDPPGGWIVRGPNGIPAGPLYETATNGAQSRSIAAYAERLAADAPGLFERCTRALHGAGITAAGDAYVSPDLWRLEYAAAVAGRLPLAAVAYRGAAEGLFTPPAAVLDEARAAVDAGPLRPDGVKLFADGGANTTATTLVPTGTAAHGRAGRLFYRQPRLDGLVLAAHERGLRVAVHAAGDQAVTMALTAIERARAGRPRVEPRFRVEHGVFLSDALIRRLAGAHVALVVQPLSVFFHADRLAQASVAPGLRYLPLRALLDAGVNVATGSDAPCYPADPLLHLRAAVTRRTAAGAVHDPEQRLSVEEALRLATVNAARAMGVERERGMLAPGLAADVVVLTDDPRRMPMGEPRPPAVWRTYRAGALVYDRERDGAPDAIGRLPLPPADG